MARSWVAVGQFVRMACPAVRALSKKLAKRRFSPGRTRKAPRAFLSVRPTEGSNQPDNLSALIVVLDLDKPFVLSDLQRARVCLVLCLSHLFGVVGVHHVDLAELGLERARIDDADHRAIRVWVFVATVSG